MKLNYIISSMQTETVMSHYILLERKKQCKDETLDIKVLLQPYQAPPVDWAITIHSGGSPEHVDVEEDENGSYQVVSDYISLEFTDDDIISEFMKCLS